MAPNTVQDFENLVLSSHILRIFFGVSDSSDSDVSFFNSGYNEQTVYFSINNITVELNSPEKDAFLILHLNIRNINKNFENSKTFLAKLGLGFQIIYLTKF